MWHGNNMKLSYRKLFLKIVCTRDHIIYEGKDFWKLILLKENTSFYVVIDFLCSYKTCMVAGR